MTRVMRLWVCGVLLWAVCAAGLSACSPSFLSLSTSSAPETKLADIKQRGYLIVGVNYGNPPFGLYAAQNDHYALKGFDVDLSQAIAKRLFARIGKQRAGHAVRFRQVLTSTRLVAVNTGAVDMIAASMSITPNREKRVAFSRPYFTVRQKIMVPAASPVKSVRDLTDKTILTVNGSTAQTRLQQKFPELNIKGYATLNEAFNALRRHEGDALSNDDALLSGLLQQHCALGHEYRMLPESLSTENYGLVFRKQDQKTDGQLQAVVDQILLQMTQDGTLSALKKRWTSIDCF